MKLQIGCAPSTHSSPPQIYTVNRSIGFGNHFNLARKIELKSVFPSLRSGVVIRPSNLCSSKKWSFRVCVTKGSEDPFRGKSGNVSFGGLSHQSIEESQLVSAPFQENNDSLLWVFGPLALISSLIVPQFFIVPALEDYFRNKLFAEFVSSLSTEIIFYVGIALYLLVTERVQKPYLEFSPKRWSLITGLRGYITSAYFTMGVKVFAPILAVCVTWPLLGLSAVVSVGPFLAGCLAQYLFERRLDSNNSSCWPLLPIIFEVYRIYQLTRATGFMEKLMFAMGDPAVTSVATERFDALLSMTVTFRILGVVCLWSLITFLMRLFPSKPVAENY